MRKLLITFISLLFIDTFFILIGFGAINFGALVRIILFNITLSFSLSFIKKEKTHKTVTILILILLSIYAFVQLEFKNFMSTFYSFKAVGNGITGVKDYIWYFISDAKPSYYLVFLSVLLFLLLDEYLVLNEKEIIENIYKKKYKDRYQKKIKKARRNFTLSKKILILTNLFTLTILAPLTSNVNDLVTAYTYNEDYDLLLSNIGTNHFLIKDLYSLIFPKKIDFIIEKENVLANDDGIIEEENLNKTIDDSKWISLMNEETNKSIKNIDEYLMSQPTMHETKHTGEFEDCNFVYFLVESLDYIAIDKQLTPTLYKIWEDGYHFTNHYTPVFACCTGDSEFVSMTGIYPLRNVCTAYEVLDTNLSTSLAGLFKEKGYTVKAFHNWDDQFYKRTRLEPAYGVDEYLDINSLQMKHISGWQSDAELVKQAIPHFIDEDKFFSFFITSSMHWPYDESSTLGDKYLKEINKVYPDYPIEVKRYISKCMELDKGIEALIDALDKADKLDDTVISIFADHRPLKFDSSTLTEHTQLVDRSGIHDINLTPFLIYNNKTRGKEITNPCSTIDHVPTIANLFNLNYDPRLYMGHDAFENNCIVIFNSLDWITKDGEYIKSSKKAIGNIDQEYIDSINAHVKNVTNISKAILDYDYFERRKSVIYPEYK